MKQVYQSRYDKPLLVARCCHVANDFTDFTAVRHTEGRTDEQKDSRQLVPKLTSSLLSSVHILTDVMYDQTEMHAMVEEGQRHQYTWITLLVASFWHRERGVTLTSTVLGVIKDQCKWQN